LVVCNFVYSNEDVVENSQELDSVEITAYRFAMNELDVPVNSQVLNREEIKQLPYGNQICKILKI
jgi:hypothetical protein